MNNKYENRQELADKIEWEGGIDEFLTGYGLKLEYLPEDDEELRDAFVKLDAALTTYEAFRDEFTDLLPESETY